jgi:4-hydroxy-4-methyl-2-oxoglutarate aldolase
MTPSDKSIGERLLALGVATIDETTRRRGFLGGIHLLVGEPFAGEAVTVALPAGDNLGVHLALQQAPVGAVVCVASAGRGVYGVVGELLLEAARVRQIAGFVVDDGVRDTARLVAPPSIAARGVAARGTAKRRIRQPVGAGVGVGNIFIAPGDWIVCDEDGVCVVPREHVGGVIAMAESRAATELQMRGRLVNGTPSPSVLGLPEHPAASITS